MKRLVIFPRSFSDIVCLVRAARRVNAATQNYTAAQTLVFFWNRFAYAIINFLFVNQFGLNFKMAENILRRNNVKISGSGAQVLMFAHGFGCDQNMWRFVAPDFEADYKIVSFDYVGSGNSDISAYKADRYADLSGYVQDVLEICDALALEDVIFVGHSVSSMIGVLASIERPALFKKLIQIVPSPCYINSPDYTGGFERADIEGLLDMMDKNYMGWASFLAPVIMKNADRPGAWRGA